VGLPAKVSVERRSLAYTVSKRLVRGDSIRWRRAKKRPHYPRIRACAQKSARGVTGWPDESM